MFDVPPDWSLPAIQTATDKSSSKTGAAPHSKHNKPARSDTRLASVSKPQGHPPSLPKWTNPTKRTNDLVGSRFRYLNEKLYTMDSASAMSHFDKNPGDFAKYHDGFARQVSSWPCNPVDKFIAKLQGVPSGKSVVDLGCGDGRLALAVRGKHRVRSFDLQSAHPHVEVGDMCNLAQVESGSTDIAIFCLSLMNTNYVDALREAHRILVNSNTGRLWIAEVLSRFPGKDHHQFSTAIGSLFQLVAADDSNGVFVLLEYQKVCGGPKRGIDARQAVLAPCLYKKR